MRQTKQMILGGLALVLLLVAAFLWGGSSTKTESGQTVTTEPPQPVTEKVAEAQGKVQDKYQTEVVPEGKPTPVEPEQVEISDEAFTCFITVRCDAILENMDLLPAEKAELVPSDGVILPLTEVVFYKGESVFNVLQREMKRNRIHMEFTSAPIYNSAYIEGINNLYEFDCGDLSGWMYKVNDWFPNYGASRYGLNEGDVVTWHYTCDLGRDLEGFGEMGGQ